MGRKTDMFFDKVIFQRDNLTFLLCLKDNKYLDNSTMRQLGLKKFDSATLELMELILFKEGPDPSYVITDKGRQVVTHWENLVTSLTKLLEE
jgi:hypothetical protein